jgi:uncharacterized small protein (DUF1192 family)
MNEIARQLRIKAEAYEDFKEDTYLWCLLKDAADTIEVLSEQVSVLTSESGVSACDSRNLASLRFSIKELTRRINAMQGDLDRFESELRDANDNA